MGGILLVSSDWRTRALLRAQLIEEGYSVMAFESLADAEKELQRSGFEPRLVIVELADGEQAASDLARLSALARQVPVWVLSSHNPAFDAQLESRGFEAVIFRPFGIKELVDRIKQRLNAS